MRGAKRVKCVRIPCARKKAREQGQIAFLLEKIPPVFLRGCTRGKAFIRQAERSVRQIAKAHAVAARAVEQRLGTKRKAPADAAVKPAEQAAVAGGSEQQGSGAMYTGQNNRARAGGDGRAVLRQPDRPGSDCQAPQADKPDRSGAGRRGASVRDRAAEARWPREEASSVVHIQFMNFYYECIPSAREVQCKEFGKSPPGQRRGYVR